MTVIQGLGPQQAPAQAPTPETQSIDAKPFMPRLKENAVWAWNATVEKLQAIGTQLKTLIQKVWQAVRAFLEPKVEWVKQSTQELYERLTKKAPAPLVPPKNPKAQPAPAEQPPAQPVQLQDEPPAPPVALVALAQPEPAAPAPPALLQPAPAEQPPAPAAAAPQPPLPPEQQAPDGLFYRLFVGWWYK